ncbi:MAG: hypothetical protein RBT49_08620 [Bacteroidales bacterium]|nr:hypothetical protein [Bacteroidales bacterium]
MIIIADTQANIIIICYKHLIPLGLKTILFYRYSSYHWFKNQSDGAIKSYIIRNIPDLY